MDENVLSVQMKKLYHGKMSSLESPTEILLQL
jgi:hypothetical protein